MKNVIEKLESAEREIARLENITRIQAKQIERLMDARDAEIVKREKVMPTLPELAGTYPLVLYFANEAEANAFAELIREAKPDMVSRHLK